MARTFYVTVICAALLAASSAAVGQGGLATQPLTDPERAALTPGRSMIELGRNVAVRACADCHGMDGVSTAEGLPHLAGQRTVYLHRVLQAYRSGERGSDPMNHAIGFLNDEALIAVSAYYASLAPPLPPAEADMAPIEAGDVFSGIRDDMKKCVRCHGEDGNSSASGMPNLSAQAPEYFVASMNAYAAGERNHKLMARLVGGLDEQTIAEMGVFYAVQAPTATKTKGDGDPEAGRALADEKCASCHGGDGNAAGADMPSLAGQDARYFVKAMEAYQDGSRPHEQMLGAVEGLDAEQLANLATFYAEQQPVRRDVRMPLTTAEWIERCERCHGIDGNSTDPRFPMLAGQNAAYLEAALESYVSGSRSNSIMHAMSDPLSESDIARIVRHYATRTPKALVYMQLPCEDNQ